MKHIPDDVLTTFYEASGLFAKIIDTPADEALRSGFDVICNDGPARELFLDVYESLNGDEVLITAIKRARLFGGCIAVMLIDDGGGIEDPLDFSRIKSIDGIRIYDRSLIDYEEQTGTSPDRYSVYSIYGNFTVHKSRCLIFKNGVLPERSDDPIYKAWGVPEYIRIYDAVKDVEISHSIIPELLNYSTQAIYKTSGLKELLSSDDGEAMLLKRLQALDIARSMLDSIIIDADGEEYDYTQIQFSGMADIIEKSVNYLSAICSIPKAFLYGEKLGPWSKSDRTTTENWYNLIERIQKKMIKSNLSYLASVIFRAGVNTGDLSHIPSVKIKFHSLWQLKETEKADIQLIKAKAQLERAKTASSYFQAGAITPEEIRKTIMRKGL